ncbi:MAG TPA: glycoside hydrolase family 88 protein [Pyrinomonadaceae bacterium]|jgi:rhamnogalacturonyl hydrolase YesR|nr:glycoside hydrolase family 88 protein [Pyrinomonadaceae bacterium]
MLKTKIVSIIILFTLAQQLIAQSDTTTPLHLLKPDYPIPYGIPKTDEVTAVLNRVYNHLNGVTPIGFVNEKTGEVFNDASKIDANTILQRGDFRIVSYEWGVTYAGMLLASEATDDPRYRDYVEKRLAFIADSAASFKKSSTNYSEWEARMPLRNLLNPKTLDDTGAMSAAMIKAKRAGSKANVQPIIDIGLSHIMTKQHRLADGTLARNRPQPNTLWLDDMFMSVPAIAQMGKLTGDNKYYDEATKQVLSFAKKMFNHEKGVYMHGWVESMTEHPEFHWARANGWAFMSEVELLEVLPEDHPRRPQIIQLLKEHARGLASYQSGSGFWHQLLDREDSYLETSATAIYTYAFARAINRGWIDAKAYGPMTLLAWNAVTTKVNAKGQVEGTCVGTGMAFDPAFYYHRPTSAFAAHGYGPVLLAGAEVLMLLKNRKFEINDSSVQVLEK